MTRVALLAGLDEALLPNATSDSMAFSFELASGLYDRCSSVGDVAVDVFARQGSWSALPLISLDPNELLRESGCAVSRYAVEEALYCQVVLSGMMRTYQLVHVLAPVSVALQLLAATDIPIVQTLLVEQGHPARDLPPRLLPPQLLRQVAISPQRGRVNDGEVPLGVDLTRFVPVDEPRDDYLLCLTPGAAGAEVAQIARCLDLPLKGHLDGDLTSLLQHARALVHLAPALSPAGAVWPLRALACGTPVTGWRESGLEAIVDRPELGTLAPRGDIAELAAGIISLPARKDVGPTRRMTCLGRYGARAMIGAYCDMYRDLLTVRQDP